MPDLAAPVPPGMFRKVLMCWIGPGWYTPGVVVTAPTETGVVAVIVRLVCAPAAVTEPRLSEQVVAA